MKAVIQFIRPPPSVSSRSVIKVEEDGNGQPVRASEPSLSTFFGKDVAELYHMVYAFRREARVSGHRT